MYTMVGEVNDFSDEARYNDYIIRYLARIPADLGALSTGRKRIVYALKQMSKFRRWAYEDISALTPAQRAAWGRQRWHNVKKQNRRIAWLRRRVARAGGFRSTTHLNLRYIDGDDLPYLLADRRFPWSSGGKYLETVCQDWMALEVPSMRPGSMYYLHLDTVLFLMSPFTVSGRTTLNEVERFVRSVYSRSLLDYDFLPLSFERQAERPSYSDIPF